VKKKQKKSEPRNCGGGATALAGSADSGHTFLFNTLNSISSLITVDPVRAEQIVGRLATLLRASLDTAPSNR